jgi:hypothetical protein
MRSEPLLGIRIRGMAMDETLKLETPDIDTPKLIKKSE